MAHTSMATIVNLQRNTGSVTLQVLSIIRKGHYYDLHTKASPKPRTRSEDSSWEPENPGMEASGDTRQDPGNFKIQDLNVVSIPSDRELRHNQSQIRLSPIEVQTTKTDGLGFTYGADRQARELRANQSVIPSTGSPASQPIISGQGSRCHYVTHADKLSKQHWFNLYGCTSLSVKHYLNFSLQSVCN